MQNTYLRHTQDPTWCNGVRRSPYRRTSQTTEALASVFQEDKIAVFQEEVQLREQDFCNLQGREGRELVRSTGKPAH